MTAQAPIVVTAPPSLVAVPAHSAAGAQALVFVAVLPSLTPRPQSQVATLKDVNKSRHLIHTSQVIRHTDTLHVARHASHETRLTSHGKPETNLFNGCTIRFQLEQKFNNAFNDCSSVLNCLSVIGESSSLVCAATVADEIGRV